MPTRVTHYRIAEIGRDGIGPDVVAEAVRVLDAAGNRIETAVAKARQEPEARTRDIGRNAITRAASEAVIRAL